LVVLVASRNERRKGLDFACEAFTLLREALHDARLMIVGVEEGSQALPAGALSVGRVDDVTLAQALRSANVVFVPSLFEAFSRVVIEAWQQERPVVVSDGVALASTVLKERGGAVVPYGDARSAAAALRRLVSDAAMADAMGRRGRRAVDQRFTLPRLLDAYERLHLRRDPAKIQTPGRTRRAVDERRTRRS
jgi:glycosyltransferase involved in cell wall biosynthesis